MGIMIVLTKETLALAYVYHVCGMFEIEILLHIDLVAFIGFTIVISTESLFTALVRHAVGMFEVAK